MLSNIEAFLDFFNKNHAYAEEGRRFGLGGVCRE